MKVLDLGCGAGTVSLAAAFSEARVSVHAVDSNARAIQSLERGVIKNEAPGITVVLDAEGQSPASDTFDLALANPPYFSNYAIADLFLDTAHPGAQAAGQSADRHEDAELVRGTNAALVRRRRSR